MAHNARYARLAIEYTKLMNLAARSSFIDIHPLELQPGWPPEKYVITYTCRGIASVDKNEAPRISNFHQVSMYMGSEYPLKEPYLRWLTPIWHPNIAHEEPHHVCTNNVQNWFAAKPLAELVLAMGEMVQYKHYHAKWIAPFPLDRAAADWVLEVAEPKGILGPGKPFDDRPLLQPQRMRKTTQGLVVPGTAATGSGKGMKLGRRPILVRSLSGVKLGDLANAVVTDSADDTEIKPGGNIKFGKIKKEGIPVTTLEPNKDGGTRLLPPLEEVHGDNDAAPAILYSLEVLKEGRLVSVEQIEKTSLSIGRGAVGSPVDLMLEGDPTISRLHALIERDETGALWLTVMGQNPVVVNGRVVPRERSIALDVGHVIEICSYSITVR